MCAINQTHIREVMGQSEKPRTHAARRRKLLAKFYVGGIGFFILLSVLAILALAAFG